MNLEQVSELVDLIGDQPVAIAGLRRLAVGLAIGGKFGAGSAEGDLQALRAALCGASRAKARPSQITEDDLPSARGAVDRFVRLGDVARIEKGRTGIQSAAPGAYPLVVTAAQRLTCDHYDFDGSAAIIPLVSSAGHGKASIQRLHYQDGKFALGTILAAIFPHRPNLLSPRFLFEYLSAFKDDLLVRQMIGTANVTLTVGKLAAVPVPLIPAAIQERVDELMALCDQLQAARTEREAARDRLALATLARLNAPDLNTFAADSDFALDALPSLSARPDQIKQLCQTILNLAVRGKLVGQNQGDEPASELLRRIAAEKVSLTATGGRGRRSQSRPRSEPFDFSTPSGWVISTLGEIAIKVTDGAHQTPTYVSVGVPFVSVKDFSAGRLDFSNTRFITEAEHRALYRRCDPKRGDILLGRIGTLGKAVLVETDIEFSLFVSVGLIRCSQQSIVPEYLRLLLNSPLVEEEFERIKIGGGTHTNKLNLGDLQTVALPIPPLNEQHRIVAKVDELIALCSQLEASLASTDATRSRLLDALLADALEPVNESEMEAAQ